MKYFIVIVLLSISLLAYNSIYDRYVNCDIQYLDSVYKSQLKNESKPSDSIVFFLAEISDNLLKSVSLYRQISLESKSPFYDISMYRLAKYYILINDSINTLNTLNKIISKKGKYTPNAYNMLITYYKKRGDFEKTKEYIKKLKSEFPNNYYALMYEDMENVHSNVIKNYYTVQIAAFKNKNNAINMMNEFIKKGYKADIYYNKELYKIILGKFENKQDALNYSKIIQKAEGISVWVIKVE